MKSVGMRWSLFLLSLERLKMQTARIGIRGGLGKRAARDYGRMLPLFPSIPWGKQEESCKGFWEDASTSSQHPLGWLLHLLSRQENPPSSLKIQSCDTFRI